MTMEADYITPSELNSDSASEWCESGSGTEWEPTPGWKSTPGQKGKPKAPPSVPTPPFVLAPSFVPAPPSVQSFAPFIPPSQYQVRNDQDKYPDLPDYMPYMPSCVPHNSPKPAVLAQTTPFTVDQMNARMQQHNVGHRSQRLQGAGGCDSAIGKSFPGAGMNLQPGIKTEVQPTNEDLLMTYSGMGLWFDPSTGRFRHQDLPQPFAGHGFPFDFEAAIPSGPSGPELAMELGPFAPSGLREPTVDAEFNASKYKASSNAIGNAIPLVCFLCEKTPKFSDVSHLLTHISSKGHLSRRFHLELQAQTDENVQQRLLQFNVWFEQHGIQRLLKTRQEAKDQKKRTQVRRQRGVGNEKKSRRSSIARETLKSEPDDALQMPASHLNPLNQQNWHHGITFDNSYQTPSNKRTQSVYPIPDSPQEVSHVNDEPVETSRQGGPGTPTLKGIFHTGMGIFDAATPEMKRIRNQRKHPSVLNNMALVSKSIGMTEQVWNESMTKVEHERNVYDTPTDLSSPGLKDDDDEDDDEPKPKKRRGPPAAPRSTGPTSERLTRSATRAMNGASTRASRGGKRGGAKRGGAKRGAGKKIPKVEDEDFESDEEQDVRRGKRGLSVFQDAAGDDGPLGGAAFGGNSQGAQGFGGSSFSGQQAAFPSRAAMQGLPSNRPMSSMYGRPDSHQFVMYDKENDRNAFSVHQTANMPGYYQPRQNIQSGAFNPLYVQRQETYANVYGPGFDSFKPSNSAFQSMNGIGYNGVHGGMNNSLNNGLSNSLNDDLHNAFNSDMAHSLNNSLSTNGLNNGLNDGTNSGPQFRSSNNGSHNNGFDIQ